ncbi:MAG: hypothetical protein EA421_03555 [Gemmatimonadales bacterium]|nr:MAG: hypothetical protein EA421_03555 [Gemmatimonadales bacterium]
MNHLHCSLGRHRFVPCLGPLVPLLGPWISGLAVLVVFLWLAGCGPEGGPESPLPETTPLEASGYDRLTTHEELVSFLESLAAGSPRVTLRELGSSVEGRSIPYLEVGLGEFGARREEKVMVMAFAQQHGNEPSGKEGALQLALELARGDHDDLLEGVDLLLVPQVNPDGGDLHQRRNAGDVDLNRSHLILDGPEVVALRELFHRWEPEVTVDVHEYYPWSDAWLEAGWLRLWDVQIGLPTNLNTHPAIRAMAEEEFLPFAIETLERRGFTGHNYIVGSPGSLRYSTSDVNDGRQGFGILNTLSFIFEGKRSEPLAEEMERRSQGQRLALEALLRFSAREGDRIRATVRGAREGVGPSMDGEFILAMGRAGDGAPLSIPVESVREEGGRWVVGDTVTAVIEAWFPRVVPERTTPLPEAYLVPAEEEALIRLLRLHHVEMVEMEGGERLEVERLTLAGFSTVELEGPTRLAEVARRSDIHEAAPGDRVIPTGQLRGLLVASALEPESMHGLLHYPEFEGLAREGDFPLLRVMEWPGLEWPGLESPGVEP